MAELGDTAAASFLEWNTRSQVTSWIPSMGCDGKATSLSGLYGYRNKVWSGLAQGYDNYKRYQLFADNRLCQAASYRAERSSVQGRALIRRQVDAAGVRVSALERDAACNMYSGGRRVLMINQRGVVQEVCAKKYE